MKFFTSDLHLFHKNVIKHANRPFADVEEMNESLVNNWNSKVSERDVTFVIGDVSFGPIGDTVALLKRMNGDKVLIRGNHDKALLRRPEFQGCFLSIENLLEIDVHDKDALHEKQRIVMCHYAMKVWNKSHYGAWHLYGHSHGTLPEDPNSLSFDVGVDCSNYSPLSYEEVKAKMAKKTFKAIDHHGR